MDGDYDEEDDDDDDGGQQAQAYADFSRLLRTLIRGFSDEDVGVRSRGNRREDRNSRSGSASTATTPGASLGTNDQSATTSGGNVDNGSDSPDNDVAAAQQQAEGQQQQQPQQQQQQQQQQQRRPRNRNRRNRNRRAGFVPLEEILEQMFAQNFGPGMFAGGGGGGGFQIMAGNPGDYAFGPRGLDDIITQLLNQYEGGGAAPAKEDEIKNITTLKITEKDVQCPVCFDEFEIGDEVKRMVCKHTFHEDCLVPWLKIHGTCPVCRSDMSGKAPEPTAEGGENASDPNPLALLGQLEQPGPSTTRSTTSSSSAVPISNTRLSGSIFGPTTLRSTNPYISGGLLRNRTQSRTTSNSSGGGGSSGTTESNQQQDSSATQGGESSSSYLDQVD